MAPGPAATRSRVRLRAGLSETSDRVHRLSDERQSGRRRPGTGGGNSCVADGNSSHNAFPVDRRGDRTRRVHGKKPGFIGSAVSVSTTGRHSLWVRQEIRVVLGARLGVRPAWTSGRNPPPQTLSAPNQPRSRQDISGRYWRVSGAESRHHHEQKRCRKKNTDAKWQITPKPGGDSRHLKALRLDPCRPDHY